MINWKSLCMILALMVALSGCGRKEAPQLTEASGKPMLSDLQSEVVGTNLNLNFTLNGNAEGVGYQIDRTQMDPYCNCPGMWRRYFEQPALAKQVGEKITKNINLKNASTEWLFRIRAVDQYGNLGAWSHMIKAKGVDLRKE